MAADASLIRAIRGPITLITLGVLFTLDHFTPYSFGRTWPVLLIVFGLLSLLRRGASLPPQPPPPMGGPWPPPPSAMSGGYTGGYRQSPYGNTGSGGTAGSSGSNPGGAGGGSR